MDKKVKTPKATWDAYATRVFCEICMEEVLAGNRPGHSLSAVGYKNLEEKFKARTQRHYPRDKLKNKWDALKPQYNLWLDLKRAATGLGFDVQKGVITASKEWWDEKIAENPKYERFRDVPMENLDELEVMFQHINVTGASSVIPGGRTSQPTIDLGDESIEGEDEVLAAPAPNETNSKGKRKVEDAGPAGKKKARNPMVRQVTRLIDVLATGKNKNVQKGEDEIIEHIEQAVNAGAGGEYNGPASDDGDMCAFRDFIANSLMADRD